MSHGSKTAAVMDRNHRALCDRVQGMYDAFAGDAAGVTAFYAGLCGDEAALVGRLWQAVKHCAQGRDDAAHEALDRVLQALSGETDLSELQTLTLRSFADALGSRLSGASAGAGNLYLGARPPGAQLQAFELLRLRTPLIPFAYAAANRAVLEAVGEEPKVVTLVDVGIGRGGQIRALLNNPQTRTRISALHVVGIEPDASGSAGSGALESARDTVLETGRSVGIETTFRGISKRAEQLNVGDLGGVRGKLICNAAFALHHVEHRNGHAPGLDRRGVLSVLREAGACSVVLVEPDSNHDTEGLEVRFLFAYRHYRSVAMSLAAMLSCAEACLVWTEFFAPEVCNVIAHDGVSRSERHESSSAWAAHLEAAGWRIDDIGQLVPRCAAPAGFVLASSAYAFSLCFEAVPLLSVLRASNA